MEEKEYLYDAFISYRHTPLDSWVAALLHKKLESYKLPRKMQDQLGRKGINRVFRDREELRTNPNLKEELEEAIRSSKYLILICSSNTLKSQWVSHEVETFAKLRDKDHILLLLVEGKSKDIIPELLTQREKTYTLKNGEEITFIEEIQPMAADIRGKNKREIRHKLSTEILRLISPILGCTFDDLKQRHRERIRKKVIIGSALLGCSIMSFGILNAWRLQQVEEQMNAKLATQSRALADQSIRLLEKGHRIDAILVALEALPKNLLNPERPLMEEVEYALSEALYSYQFDLKMLPDRVLEYTNMLEKVQLSPEGTKATTQSSNGGLQIWNMKKSMLLYDLASDNEMERYTKTEFVDEIHLLLLNDEGLKMMNTQTGDIVWKQSFCYSGEFMVSSSKEWIAVADLDDLVILETFTGKEAARIALKDALYMKGLAWSEDEKYIAAAGYMENLGVTQVWNWKAQELTCSYTLEDRSMNEVAFVGNDKIVAATAPYHAELMDDFIDKGQAMLIGLKITDGEKAQLLWSQTLEKSHLTQLSLNNGKDKIIGVGDNVLYIFNAESGKIEKQYTGASDLLNYVIVGEMAYCGFEDGSVKTIEIGQSFTTADIDFSHEGGNTSFDFAGGRVVLTSKQDKAVYIYSALTGDAKAINEKGQYIYELKEGNKGDIFYSYYESGEGSQIMIWQRANSKKLCEIDVDASVAQMGFTSSDEILYVLGRDQKLRFYNTKTGKLINEIKPEEDSLRVSVYEIQSDEFIFLHDGEALYEIGTKTCDIARKVKNEDWKIEELIKLSDDSLLCLNDEGILKKINLYTGEITKVMEKVTNIVANKNQSEFAIYDMKGEIGIWNQDLTQRIWQFEAEGSALTYMGFEEAANRLWACYKDTGVYMYNLKNGSKEEFQEELAYPVNEIRFYQNKGYMAMFIAETQYQQAAYIYKEGQNYKKVAFIPSIEDVSKNCDAFYCVGFAGKGYVVPFYNVEELKEKAQKTVGGSTLSEKEKRMWFVSE